MDVGCRCVVIVLSSSIVVWCCVVLCVVVCWCVLVGGVWCGVCVVWCCVCGVWCGVVWCGVVCCCVLLCAVVRRLCGFLGRIQRMLLVPSAGFQNKWFAADEKSMETMNW